MSELETIVEELKSLPPGKLADAAVYIHQLTTGGESDRSRALDRAYGCLTEAEADGLEAAVHSHCERIDASHW